MELGRTIRKNVSDYTVIDIEASSKYIYECEIIELAAVRVRDSKIVAKYSTLIKPKKRIDDEVTELTGITNEMLESAPAIEEKLPEYIGFIEDDIILGHNIASFDRHIISRYCSELDLFPLINDTLDTLHYSRCCNIEVPDHKLTTLTSFFGIEHSDAHRALADCIANFECYERLKEYFDASKKLSNEYIPKSDVKVDESVLSDISGDIDISGKTICVTGQFDRGSRESIIKELEQLGAIKMNTVSGKTNFLIVGGHGSQKWAYGNYGGKIKKALELQEQGKNVIIISEEDLFKCLTV